ncbi:N/A [soil metagenome]
MNPRSLVFRLSAWYAGVCFVVCLALAACTYFWLLHYLTALLAGTLERRVDQISALWELHATDHDKKEIITEIRISYAPEQNDRFIRIRREDGQVLYSSGSPTDKRFDPAEIPFLKSGNNGSAVLHKLPSQNMLVVDRRVATTDGIYHIEYGASLEPTDKVLSAYFAMLMVGTPIVLLIAVGGGYVLVRKSLEPVRKITAAARDLSYHKLHNRLPVSATGDELEKLSVVLNEMIARLEASFQHSQRFSALASHELRTPLTIIIGDLEAMLRNPGMSVEMREKIASVFEEAERLAGITEGLFAIARLEAGEGLNNATTVDLSTLVQTTADQMALLAEEKGLVVHCEADRGVEIVADKARIKQVIVNLLDNAVKYSRPSGHVTLRVRRAEAFALMTVEDSGFGLPEEALPHVFESFYRASDPRTRSVEGAGLGLSIVRSICTAHGGSAEIANRSEGGCTVTVRLPLQEK